MRDHVVIGLFDAVFFSLPSSSSSFFPSFSSCQMLSLFLSFLYSVFQSISLHLLEAHIERSTSLSFFFSPLSFLSFLLLFLMSLLGAFLLPLSPSPSTPPPTHKSEQRNIGGFLPKNVNGANIYLPLSSWSSSSCFGTTHSSFSLSLFLDDWGGNSQYLELPHQIYLPFFFSSFSVFKQSVFSAKFIRVSFCFSSSKEKSIEGRKKERKKEEAS